MKNWQHVANCLPGRAANQCHARWRQESRANEIKSGKWSELEERKLVLAVLAYGEKNLSQQTNNNTNNNNNNNQVEFPEFDESQNVLNSTQQSSTQKTKSGRDHKIWMKISNHVPGR